MRIVLCVLTLLCLYACGGEVSSDEYLARARAYLAESDYESATIELQNALKKDADQAEARWLLGEIQFNSGNIAAAEHEYQRAQELGWSADDIVPALARTQLAQGNLDEVLALEHQALGATAAATLLSIQSLAALGAGEEDKSRELIARAQSLDANSLQVELAQATLRMNHGDFEGVLESTQAVLDVDPDNAQAWRLQGQALLRMDRLEEARDALDQAIALSRIAFGDRFARGLINLQFKEYAAAQEDAAVLMELAPENPSANYLQGMISFQNKDYLGAAEALVQAVPIVDNFPLIPYYLSLSYLMEGSMDLALNFAAQFVELAPDNSAGRKLYAITLLQAGNAGKAQEVLRPVLESNPKDLESLNIMANAFLLDDQAYAGMVLYGRIARLNPDWSIVPLRHETALVKGRFEKDGKRGAVAKPDDDANFPQTQILQIRDHLENKDFAAAIEVAKAYQFRDLEHLSPHHVLGKVYQAAGQADKAREAYGKALARNPGDSFANQNLALLALESEDADAARGYYEDILRHNVNDLSALMQLAALEARENNAEVMVKRLKQAIRAHPQALEPRLSLARYYLASGDPGRVPTLFVPLGELQRKSPRVLEITGVAYLSQQQFDAAFAAFEPLVEAQPGSVNARYLLAMAAHGLGDSERSKAELQEAIKIDAKNVPALLSLARIALEAGEREQFAGYLATLKEQAPESPDVVRLQAQAAQASGNTAEALALARRIHEQNPTTQTLMELVSYHKSAGNNGEARDLLQDWIKKNPRDITARVALAGQLELMKDARGAMTQYREILTIAPDNVVALNNLAWHLKDADPARALEYVNRAVKLAPGPAVLDTQALILHLSGDNEGAHASIRKALAGAPEEPSIRYHAAMIDAARGETEAAVKTLAAITADGAADFPERAEAVKLLAALRRERAQ